MEYAAAHLARLVEGYLVQTGGRRLTSVSAHTGTAGMFDRAGFRDTSPTMSRPGSGLPRVVMRRDVQP